MNREMLLELGRHQAWADAAHWKALRENGSLVGDSEIRKRLNHMLIALRITTEFARGGQPDPSRMPEIESAGELEAAMQQANAELIETLRTADLEKPVALPRGPRGPFEAPASALLLQAISHGQYHRGQNASRMRQLGATPPLTDFIAWYALGRP